MKDNDEQPDDDRAPTSATWMMALLVCLLVFQCITMLKLTRMTWQLDIIDKQGMVINLRLQQLKRSVDSLAAPGAVDTVEHIDRWQYRSWQEFLDSLAAEGYRIDSATFETRGPI